MKYISLIFILLFLASCQRINVNPDDQSPPELIATVVAPSNINATYTDDDTAASGTLDTSRHFRVSPRSDRQKVQLIFSARDIESGISQIRGTFEITYRCIASVQGVIDQKDASATITEQYFGRDDPGVETSAQRVVLVEFDYESLWQKGDCTNRMGITDITHGSIEDVRVNYTGRAWNNSIPVSAPSVITGRFSSSNLNVSLD